HDVSGGNETWPPRLRQALGREGGYDYTITMTKLADRVAILTGSGRGRGTAIGRGVVHEGARLGVTARSRDELSAAAQELTAYGAAVLAVAGDITEEPFVETLFQQALDRFGRIDLLVN